MGATFVTIRTPNRQAFTVVLDARIELGREADGIVVVDNRVRAVTSRWSRGPATRWS